MCLFEPWDPESFSFADPPPKPPSPPSSPSSTSLIPAQTALSIPELLSTILTHLPPSDLLTKTQLVNRTWKAAIERTPAIKRKLWQRLNNPQVVWPVDKAQLPPNSRGWPGASWTEVRTLRGGVPVYKAGTETGAETDTGVFEVNTLALPSASMQRDVRKQLKLEKAKQTAAAASRPSSSTLARLRSSLTRRRPAGPPPQQTAQPTTQQQQPPTKPHPFQVSLVPTPLGTPLATIGLHFSRDLCRSLYALASSSSNILTTHHPLTIIQLEASM